ncbi:hypothetical protein FQV39_20545 [Bosea sp. F3-2]|uniref:hypothetical protein n=1 Tax=Bosea sp. F3-2 TaxID=2599640 RepID=UPI0011EF711F|nr:hypothetical protein [Bosea sp. F3-2]QEL24707.1 hypothetical protein FQV39_20545 [Bosea sp. F3-2]
MTTKKQIKVLFDQLASRHDNIIVRGSIVMMKPLHHVYRAVSIERSSSADYPHFHWHIGHAFNPFGSIYGFGFEEIWLPKEGPRRWSEPSFAEAAIAAIEQQGLSLLRRVQTINDMFLVSGELRAPQYNGRLHHYEPNQIHIFAALGRFEEATTIYEQIKDWYLGMTSWPRPVFEKASKLGALVAAGDRPAVAALLHEWEEEFATKNDLLPIYERTPFPLELQPQPS